MRRITLLLVCLLLLPPVALGDEPSGKAIPLFDGKTLDSWKRAGGKPLKRYRKRKPVGAIGRSIGLAGRPGFVQVDPRVPQRLGTRLPARDFHQSLGPA